MVEITGKYNTAKVYTENLEMSALFQIQGFCDQPFFADSKIRIMPDVHAGKGCTIGTTMTITDKVVPNVVGVDIGCGMLTVKLKEKDIDLPKLDAFIAENIPYGRDVRDRAHRSHGRLDIYELCCAHKIDLRRAKESIGSLGGGNHFIEIDTDGERLYLVIHTGSRNLGLRVAEYYQKHAAKECRKEYPDIPPELAFVSGNLLEKYLHDMEFMQRFAALNRTVIKEVILEGLGLAELESFSTIHNYIDTEQRILRKGAVSAKSGEKLIIPMNMRDGSLICTGLGNPDWNYSAPHGAGRLVSRKNAFASLSLDGFQSSMEGIYTTSVARSTIDEAPMVYKPMDEIMRQIKDTVTIDKIIKPIYNFKASESSSKLKKK